MYMKVLQVFYICLRMGFTFTVCVAVNNLVWGKKRDGECKKMLGISERVLYGGEFKNNKNKNPPLWVPPA